MRVGVMYYHRTNRDQIGTRNTAVPPQRLHAVHGHRAERPGRHVASPKPMTATVYNLLPAFNGLQNNILDNDPFLDTDYNGVEFTAQKRFSQRWQMVAGLHDRQEHRRHQRRPARPVGIDTARSERSQHHGLRQRHRRQRLAVRVPPVGQLSRAVRHPGRRHPGVEHRLSVHVDLLGDAARRPRRPAST